MQSRTRHFAGASFESREDAREAIRALRQSGFTEDEIGVTVLSDGTEAERVWLDETVEQASVDATRTTAAGGAIGALLGAGAALLIPGVGLVAAAGILAGAAAAGAFAGGLYGPMVSLGATESEATFFEQEFKRGRAILTVQTEQRAGEALEILQRHGGLTPTA
jgi:phage-related tail protein